MNKRSVILNQIAYKIAASHVMLQCNTCRHDVLLVPMVPSTLLYDTGFDLSFLFKFLMENNDFFLCHLCCQVLSSSLTDRYISKSEDWYYCFVCKYSNSIATAYRRNTAHSLSEITEDYPIYNTKYVCGSCTNLIEALICIYQYNTSGKMKALICLWEYAYATKYMCEPRVLPFNIERPLRRVTVPQCPRYTKLQIIDDVIADNFIELRRAIFSSNNFVNRMLELQSLRTVFQCVAEMTRNVQIRFKSEVTNQDNQELDCRPPLPQIQKGVALTEAETYIQPNTEDSPIDWDFLEKSDTGSFGNDSYGSDTGDVESEESHLDEPSCSFNVLEREQQLAQLNKNDDESDDSD